MKKKSWMPSGQTLTFLVLMLAVAVFFTAVTPDRSFARGQNISNMLSDTVIPGIFALGMGIIFAGGGFDLSLGHIASIAALTTAYMMSPSMNYVPAFAIFVGLGLAAVIGLTTGVIVSRFGVSSFIVTLGMQFVIIGVRQIITKGQSVYISHTGFKRMVAQNFGISNMVFILAFVAFLCYLFMERTTVGRKIQFVGSNMDAGEYKGIDIRNLTLLTFVLGAVLAAFGGVIFAARAGAVQINSVDSKLLDAITIAVLSGVLFGRYRTVGILLVALLISMISTGLSMMGIRAEWVEFVKGFIMIVSIVLSRASGSFSIKNKIRIGKREVTA